MFTTGIGCMSRMYRREHCSLTEIYRGLHDVFKGDGDRTESCTPT